MYFGSGANFFSIQCLNSFYAELILYIKLRSVARLHLHANWIHVFCSIRVCWWRIYAFFIKGALPSGPEAQKKFAQAWGSGLGELFLFFSSLAPVSHSILPGRFEISSDWFNAWSELNIYSWIVRIYSDN